MQNIETVIPGTFVSIFGVGAHIIGEPGIGKSELALSLLAKNHQLIADDSPLFYLEDNQVIGKNQLPKHFIHLRGIGVLDIHALFGPSAVKNSHPLNLMIQLYTPVEVTCPLTPEESTKDLLGCLIPFARIPIIKPRNLEVITEVIVKNYLLKINKEWLSVASLDELLARMRHPDS